MRRTFTCAALTCAVAAVGATAADAAAPYKVSGDRAAIAYVEASAKRYEAVQTVNWTATGYVELQEDALDEFAISAYNDWWGYWLPSTGGSANPRFCVRGRCGNQTTEPAVERGTARLKDGKVVWVREIWTPRKTATPIENSHPVEVIQDPNATYWRFTDGALGNLKGSRYPWVPSSSPCFTRSPASGTNNDIGGPGTEVGTAWFGTSPWQIVPAGTVGATNYLPLSQTAGTEMVDTSSAWSKPWDLMDGITTSSTAVETQGYNRTTGLKTSAKIVVAPGSKSDEPGFTMNWSYSYAKAAPVATTVKVCAR